MIGAWRFLVDVCDARIGEDRVQLPDAVAHGVSGAGGGTRRTGRVGSVCAFIPSVNLGTHRWPSTCSSLPPSDHDFHHGSTPYGTLMSIPRFTPPNFRSGTQSTCITKLRAGQIKDARYRSRRVLELAGDAAYPLTHPTVAESVTLLLAGPRKRHVKRPPYIYERQAPNRHHEQPNEADKEEREIDQILADSFPASDSPPWTFGVAETLPRTPNTKRSKLLIG